jgi:two-component system, OmpR family, response regulator
VKLLLVDDEAGLTRALKRGLLADGFAVEIAADGARALELTASTHFDAIVLDIMLPKVSGYEVLKRLRERPDWTPVLMLSAKDGEYDQADALDLGADDYLIKPFSYVVLLARLRALARRGREPRPALLSAGPVRLDPARRSVTVDGQPVELTPREYRLLEALMRSDGAVLAKVDLLEQVFDANPDGAINIVEVYVGYLRRKLGATTIVTVHSGYRMINP